MHTYFFKSLNAHYKLVAKYDTINMRRYDNTEVTSLPGPVPGSTGGMLAPEVQWYALALAVAQPRLNI